MSVTPPAPVVGWRPAVASFGWLQRAAGCHGWTACGH